VAGMVCEYGTDPRPACHTRLTSVGDGTTSLTTPRCTVLPPVTCPATREAAAGQACTPLDAYCGYGDLTCQCTNCTSGPVMSCSGATTWHCAAPNADATCPAGIPALGSACAVEGKTCTYACGDGNGRVCKQGYWFSATGGPCPVSSRRAKKDIRYVDDKDQRALAEALLRFKLATYEYTDPALAGRKRLGFIIEDVPQSPAVDRDGNMVDLYGYTSMVVAALQQQAKEIERLKQELSSLRAHRRKPR